MMKHLRYVIILAALLCMSVHGVAQGQNVVLLKGNILDNSSGKPVEITFTDHSGKSVRASSAGDNSYQTVLKSGESYKVSIDDENFQHFTFSLKTPDGAQYKEMSQDFSLKAPLPPTEQPAQQDNGKKVKSKRKTKAKKTKKGK